MKTRFLNLSLATFVALTTSLSASDSLTEALQSSTIGGSVFSYYDMDKTEYFPPASSKNPNRQHIGGIGAELKFLTGSYYGFRLALTAQGLVNFAPSSGAKEFYAYDWNSEGVALSEAYLGYESSYIDLKIGRQYYNSKYTGLIPPLVATNTDVGYKEAFEGVSARIKLDSINTVIGLADFWKFSGRSSAVTGGDHGAPRFKDKVIIGGFGPYGYEFDNIFNSFVTYSGISGVSLTAGYANISDLKYDDKANSNGDIDFYFGAAGYKTPVLFENAVVGIDFMYKGSRTNDSLKENFDFNGDFYTGMVGLYNAYGFDFRYAYSTVSKNQMALQGIGNDVGSFTATPIYGPFLFMSFAGMNLHKFSVGYDFSNVGVDGFRLDADYWSGKQHNGSNVRAGGLHGQAPGTRIDVEGWDIQATYKVPTVKGLKLSAIYETMDRELKYTSGGFDGKTTDEELWLRATYDFDILK
ncbi:metalloid reductase RarA [Campylobacter mucosalis]|uniref:metalloid reductase RarA n=1 Tax=Campylobacter mucosalis TaxID=202 RepID=UPI00146FF83D|nr:metalloid reductase RarA [Campylobacter mucosalis]